MYDKYRDWPLPGSFPGARPISMAPRISLEEQVLKDLSEAKEEVEKLEILDSYACYYQRAYRQEFAESSAALTGRTLGELLAPIFLDRLPPVVAHSRPRVGKVG